MVNEVNRTAERHILTVEDPIEFLHTPDKSAISMRQIGKHVDSFSAALRSALRESPDVLVVGEMRDFETIHLAMSAAETGVLVFGTLHTNSAAKAADRVIDSFPEEGREQARGVLSVLLKGVVSQHLVKKISGEGRVVCTEILLHTVGVANLIRENKTFQIDSFLQTAEHAGTGMQSLDSCLFKYVKEGLVDLDEALKIAHFPDTLKAMCASIVDEEAAA
jgi:twitching motility protein PilT